MCAGERLALEEAAVSTEAKILSLLLALLLLLFFLLLFLPAVPWTSTTMPVLWCWRGEEGCCAQAQVATSEAAIDRLNDRGRAHSPAHCCVEASLLRARSALSLIHI